MRGPEDAFWTVEYTSGSGSRPGLVFLVINVSIGESAIDIDGSRVAFVHHCAHDRALPDGHLDPRRLTAPRPPERCPIAQYEDGISVGAHLERAIRPQRGADRRPGPVRRPHLERASLWAPDTDAAG